MTPHKQAIRTVAGCHPRYARAIERAYGDSSEFRAICDDLFVCDKALLHWQEVQTGEGASRRKEYGELFEALKREVLEWLEAHGLLCEDESGDPGQPPVR